MLGGWIFTHPYIRKEATGDETWLLRSPETDEYDLLNVQGEWSIWLGRIDTTSVSISCNRCREDADLVGFLTRKVDLPLCGML